jgi:lipoprotein-anchoring transpeptidase ErfK/SrfK
MRTPGWMLLVLFAVLSASCSVRDPRFSEETVYLNGQRSTPDPGRANFDNVSYWDGDGVSGSPFIRIALGEQKAYFYKGGELVGVSAISSGREEFYTPTGRYKIIQKNRHHKSNLYGDYVDADGNVIQKDVDVKKDPKPPGAKFDGAKMPYFMRIVGGVGMHEGFLPGYPASHGCIRMPGFMAEAFFANVAMGTPVEVTH